ncbi:MAG: hypothetical protein WBK91_01280 [Alphaproteobacteria bacterium]
MAEEDKTPSQVKKEMIADITGVMLLRPEDANGKPTGQPTNLPAWGVIFNQLKSGGMKDRELKTQVSSVIQDFSISHTARTVLMAKVDQDHITPEQTHALEQRELAAFNHLSGFVGAALEDPQVRQKLEDAILKNSANANPQIQEGVKGLFGAFAEAQQNVAAQKARDSEAPRQESNAPPAPPTPGIQLVAASSDPQPLPPTVIKVDRGSQADEALNQELVGKETLTNGEKTVGLIGAGALVARWLIKKYSRNNAQYRDDVQSGMEEMGYSYPGSETRTVPANPAADPAKITTVPEPGASGATSGGQNTPASARTNVPEPSATSTATPAGTSTGTVKPAAVVANTGATSTVAPPPGPATTGAASTTATATGSAATGNVAGQTSLLSRGMGWVNRMLGRASTPVAVATTSYFAVEDFNRGDYRGATTKLAAGGGALGGAYAGAALGTMIFPGFGTFLGGVGGGIAGYFLGEKGGEMTYDAVVAPDATSRTAAAAGKTLPEPTIDEPGRPNGLKHMKEDTITWGTVLATTAAVATRKTGWGRLAMLAVGGGVGVVAGNYFGFEKDKKAAAERANNPLGGSQDEKSPLSGALKLDAASGKGAKGKDKDGDEEKPASSGDETDDWLKKIVMFLMMLIAKFSPDLAKSIGEMFGIDDAAKTAKAGAGKGVEGGTAEAPKTMLAPALSGTRAEMLVMMDLINSEDNKGLLKGFTGIMQEHAFKDPQKMGSFLAFKTLADQAAQGDATARAALPDKLQILMKENPQLAAALNKDIIPALRDQHHAQIATHNAAVLAASNPSAGQKPGVDAVAVGQAGDRKDVPAASQDVARVTVEFPPTRLEMQMLHAKVADPAASNLRERLNDLVSGHGFRAFQKRAEAPFHAYVTSRNNGDQARMSQSLLAITEQFPDFSRELYRDVMPGVIGSDQIQHARALDTLMQPGQEAKLKEFSGIVAQRAGALDQAAASAGKGQDGTFHRSLLEALKLDRDGQPGVRENMPQMLAKAATADPTLEAALFQLGTESMTQRPVVAQISTAIPTTQISSLNGQEAPQGQQGDYARVVPLDGRLVAASAASGAGQEDSSLFGKLKGYLHEISRPRAGTDPIQDFLGIPPQYRRAYGDMKPRFGSQPSVGGHVINPVGVAATQTITPTPHTFTFNLP